MTWNKRKKSAIAVYLVATIVFILLSTVIPFSKPAGSWLMFAFTIVSFIFGAFVSLYAFSKEETLTSKFYGYPVFRIGIIYTVSQLICCIVVYIVGAFFDVPFWIGFLISLLLLGFACIGVITTDNSRDYIEEIEQKTQTITKTTKKFNNDIFDILDICENESTKQSLYKLATKFKYSDPVSSEATEEKELAINDELLSLKQAVIDNDEIKISTEIKVITNLLNSRNRICESSK